MRLPGLFAFGLSVGFQQAALAGLYLPPANEAETPFVLMTLEPAQDATTEQMVSRQSLRQDADETGFSVVEKRLTAAAAGDDANSIATLAQFYAAHDFWPEALATLLRLGPELTGDNRLFAAEAEYRMGRYRQAAARLADAPGGGALLAMALTRLGAYVQAHAGFAAAQVKAFERDLDTDYWLCRAEAAIAVNDREDADQAFKRLAAIAPGAGDEARRSFLRGRYRLMAADGQRAEREFRQAAAMAPGAWSMRARLQLADPDSVQALQSLGVQWAGPAFDRELNLALSAAALRAGNFEAGFRAGRRVVDRHPQSDAALVAQSTIAAALPLLFADKTAISAEDASRLFFENIEFAPPGSDGDELIQAVADRFKALGLYRQAASLLEHQVFKRLRGADRSRIAADLAALYLDAGDAKAALRVVRSTRIVGLDDQINARRRRLEALALAKAGDIEEAAALLTDSASARDIRLRADINWLGQRWKAAATDYASAFAAADGALEATDREAALRAATAFLLADDAAGYQAFADEATARLGNAAEAALIASLDGRRRGKGGLAAFMKSYRASYGLDSLGG